jgi:hypothetical protein
MVVATKKLHGCAFELFLSLHLFQTWSWNNRTTLLRKWNSSKQGMKSNLDQMKQTDSLDLGLEVFLLCFYSLAAEQGQTICNRTSSHDAAAPAGDFPGRAAAAYIAVSPRMLFS